MPRDAVDLYALLQVHPTATVEVIKKAYHVLMQKHHPDRGGDLQQAQRINQAYDILINTQKRAHYDQRLLRKEQLRVQMQQQKQQQAEKQARAQAEAKRYQPPAELTTLSGAYQTPILWGKHILVSDERGNRVALLDRKKETVWSLGRTPQVALKRPLMAHFAPDQTLWVADSGSQRVLQFNLKKELLWEYSDPTLSQGARQQSRISFLDVHQPGEVLLTDSGLRRVTQVDTQGNMLWHFEGKLAFNLRLQHQLIKPELFMPVSAMQVEPRCFLIADQGNGRIFKVNHKGKLLWIYPDKKQPPLTALNFAAPLPGGRIWIASDKLIEVSEDGQVLWHYAELQDADIKQAYALQVGAFMVDFSHLVKRGINQEIMMVSAEGKVQYRHYYSQHRFL
jgi:curved DNA-binding protein CbpA